MAPKVKITKEDIIGASLKTVKEKGIDALNARDVAAQLGCSTQPIFSNFSSMEELEEETLKAAYGIYLSYLDREANSEKYPKYKAFGMAYIRFAKEEKELFKTLFMRDRKDEDLSETEDFTSSVDYIVKSTGIDRQRATLMHLEIWSAVHGIATMFATSFLSLSQELVENMLTDVYLGLKERHTEERV